MITEYIQAAMHLAQYELIDDGTWFGSIPGFEGLWANAPTQSDCVVELQSVLEGWILLGLHMKHSLPIVQDINLNPDLAEVA